MTGAFFVSGFLYFKDSCLLKELHSVGMLHIHQSFPLPLIYI